MCVADINWYGLMCCDDSGGDDDGGGDDGATVVMVVSESCLNMDISTLLLLLFSRSVVYNCVT